jgi:hypothetical protein
VLAVPSLEGPYSGHTVIRCHAPHSIAHARGVDMQGKRAFLLHPKAPTPALLAMLILGLTSFAPIHASDVPAGTIMVIDSGSGTNGQGALYEVDPNTGTRTLVSDFGNASQGPTGQKLVAITIQVDALGLNSTVLVADAGAGTGYAGALFSVDPVTGQRTLLSDYGVDSQGPGYSPSSVLATSPLLNLSSTIFTTDPDYPNNQSGADADDGALIQVSTDGSRSVTSDFNDASLGTPGEYATGLAITSNGTLLVVDADAGTNEQGSLYSVNNASGSRNLITDFGNLEQGSPGGDPVGVTVVTGLLGLADTPAVIDNDSGTDGIGNVFTINLSTGQRTVLSDMGNSDYGPIGADPVAIAYAPGLAGLNAKLLVLDDEAGADEDGDGDGQLFSIDPSTGQRTVLSDFNDATQGPLGVAVTGIAVR